MSERVLTVEDLRVDLPVPAGTLHAVQGVSFHVDRGETVCIVGESGCGKSLTALAIMDLLPRKAQRTAARLELDGQSLLGVRERRMSDIRGNRMAMIYGYLFPTVFLVAFRVLYRAERMPLANHLGELLTVTILGGAALGFPTTLVSERERGVWRRYRLSPMSAIQLVTGALAARFFIVITSALLQFVLARFAGVERA